MKNGSVYRCVEMDRFFAMEFSFSRWIYLFKQAKTRKYCCFALLFVLFEGGAPVFLRAPAYAALRGGQWNFRVETSLVFAVKFAAFASKFAQKANRSGSRERLCPREISASPRGEGFCRRVISTLAPQKTAGRTLRPAVPG